jgi:hypothetical protein
MPTPQEEEALKRAKALFVEKFEDMLVGFAVQVYGDGRANNPVELWLKVIRDRARIVLGRAFDAAQTKPPAQAGIHLRKETAP